MGRCTPAPRQPKKCAAAAAATNFYTHANATLNGLNVTTTACLQLAPLSLTDSHSAHVDRDRMGLAPQLPSVAAAAPSSYAAAPVPLRSFMYSWWA